MQGKPGTFNKDKGCLSILEIERSRAKELTKVHSKLSHPEKKNTGKYTCHWFSTYYIGEDINSTSRKFKN